MATYVITVVKRKPFFIYVREALYRICSVTKTEQIPDFYFAQM
jgi:hypothetical protein